MLDEMEHVANKNRAEFEEAIGDFALLEFACLEWGHYAQQIAVEDIREAAIPLLSNSSRLVLLARVDSFRSSDVRRFKERTWTWAYSGGAGISIAARFGLTDLLRILIMDSERAVPLDVRDAYGNTALHEATFFGHEAAAELLLENGADYLIWNDDQSIPLYLAVSYRQMGMVKVLLRHGKRIQLDRPGPKGFTPLHKAVEQGDEEIVSILLDAGALVGATTGQGMDPLHLAALHGYLSIAKLLVHAGAFVHVKDRDSLCPLDFAATSGFTELVTFLHEKGGSIFHKGRELWTPLHRAARGGHLDTVRFIVDRGANRLISDFKENIPLHLAVRSGNMEVVRILVEHNTDSDLKHAQLFAQDKKGTTPREVAFFCARYDIHKYLRAAEWEIQGVNEPSGASLITTAIEKGDLATVKNSLMKDRKYLDTVDEDGQPPLHVAVLENQKAIVEYLLSQGASIETVGYHGWRALHIAASVGNLDLVDFCLANGAKINARTKTNQTPLHKAASSLSIPVVRRLISAGADTTAMNDRGMTALHVAAHQNNMEMVRMLTVDYGVDVLARDRLKLTAAMWAERSAHMAVWAFLDDEEKKAKSRKRSVVAVREEVEEEVRESQENWGLAEMQNVLGGLDDNNRAGKDVKNLQDAVVSESSV